MYEFTEIFHTHNNLYDTCIVDAEVWTFHWQEKVFSQVCVHSACIQWG